MSDYKQVAETLRSINVMEPFFTALQEAAALCEAAASGEDERERCIAALEPWEFGTSDRPGEWQRDEDLVGLLMRERAAARAPVEAELAVLQKKYDALVKAVLAVEKHSDDGSTEEVDAWLHLEKLVGLVP